LLWHCHVNRSDALLLQEYSSQLARNDRAELQCPAADYLVGHIDATLGEYIFDVAVVQSEAEIEPDGLLDDDARKAVAAV